MRIDKVVSGVEYRIDEQFQNCGFPNSKNFGNLLIF